jgi:hypothetical protein
VRLDLPIEKRAPARGHVFGVHGIVTCRKRHALGVAQFGIRLRVAVLVAAYRRRLVALRQRSEHRLPGGRRHCQPGAPNRFIQHALENRTVRDKATRQGVQQIANRLLPHAACGLLLGSCGALLLRFRECTETLFVLQTREAVRTHLKVEPQRPLDGDLPETEMRRRKDAADDDVLLLPVF